MRLLVLLLLAAVYTDAEIHSCGGFIKSSVPIDYSKIQVKLLTPEGHMKHEEDCNPKTGYYMIPVYNKGQYSLKVSAPPGWFFEPQTFDFKLDGVNDPCTKNEDINFKLTGFEISGVVESASNGLPLSLVKDGKVIEKTSTDKNGAYKFKAPPGKYEVVTAGDTSACISRDKAIVEVLSSPVRVTPALRVTGYHMSVKVTNKGQALAGVPITLYTDDKKEFINCAPSSTVAKFACAVGKTGKAGLLEMACTAIGTYKIKAEFTSGTTAFQFTPEMETVNVKDNKVDVSFSVSGFSARGRVLTASRKPMKDVMIFGSGRRTSTDADGYYQLEKLQEGVLDVTASAANTLFDPMSISLKLPNVAIPDLVATGYDVCGSVEKEGSRAAEPLVLKRKDTGDVVSLRPDTEGNFCRMVAPAKYEVSPGDVGSSLTPRSLDIDLTDSPVLGLRFTHFKTDAEAHATCIGSCRQISMTLLQGETVVQSVEGAEVTFRDIGPGTYKVRISDEEGACWEETELPLVVERSRPSAVHFVQSGFTAAVRVSHPTKLRWVHHEKKELKGELVASGGGVASMCVPVQGRYRIHFESCFVFPSEFIEINVPSREVVEAQAVSARISGKINSKTKESFTIKIKSASGARDLVVSASGEFSFNEPLTSVGEIVLVPASQTHLFEPISAKVDFRGKCIDDAASFVADKGIFIDGKVRPPVQGVKIVATHKQDSNVKFETTSDKSGHYRVGPVRRESDISVSAQLDGYAFTETSAFSFASVKLSQLSVVLEDGATGERLDGVLLSVVGGKEYRSNNIVDKTGEMKFVGLAPGDYFVRPILQEYKFDPSTTTVLVKEGEHQHIDLRGKRVAFSVMGKVRELSGSAVADVALEAVSEACDQHQSDTVTDTEGSFRIRALKPGCSYRVAPKASEDKALRHCFPSQFDVKMTAEDVVGLELVAAPVKQDTQLIAEVDFGTMAIPVSYTVVVTRVGSGDVVARQSVQAPVSVFYQQGLPRDGQEYAVRIEPERPHDAFPAKTVKFTADVGVRVVRVPMSIGRSAAEIEISFGSIVALPFFALLALAFFNQAKTLELLQYAASSLSRGNQDKRRKKN